MPRIAAVIVAFDRDNLLERAIQSVKEQSQNIDLIIVVDSQLFTLFCIIIPRK